MRHGTTMLATLACGISWSTVIMAQVQAFTYRAPRYPGSAENCAAAAQALGERFSRLSGHTVGRTGCEVRSYGTRDIVVTYAAEVPIKIVSTVDELALEMGFYEKRHDCETALPHENAKFQEYKPGDHIPRSVHCHAMTSQLNQKLL